MHCILYRAKMKKCRSEVVNSVKISTSKICHVCMFCVEQNIRCFELKFCMLVEYNFKDPQTGSLKILRMHTFMIPGRLVVNNIQCWGRDAAACVPAGARWRAGVEGVVSNDVRVVGGRGLLAGAVRAAANSG